MIRAWIIFSTLTFSVLFKFYRPVGKVGFPFSQWELNTDTYVYFILQHLSEIAIAGVLLIKDDTPRFLLWLYFGILIVDMIHYLLFYRDEGMGFNFVKVLVYGVAILYFSLWKQFKR